MTGEALVCKLKNLEPIEDADNLLKADMYGETVIVSKDHEEGELGLLFDCETQLSHEFAHHNNLYRHSELNKDQEQRGYFDDNRRVRPIRLRGVKCSAFWMPIESLDWILADIHTKDISYPKEGSQITEVANQQICKKYIRKGKQSGSANNQGKKKASLADKVPYFYEHFKTGHFFRETKPFSGGDIVIMTEKLHGTSCRCGLSIVNHEESFLSRLKRILTLNKQQSEYKFVVGSRRVVKSVGGESRKGVNHYYNEDLWTKASNEHFKGKLNKGETVYFEIVGFTPTGSPIMGTHSNNKLKDFMEKEEYQQFKEKYGENTIFSYGCDVGKAESKVFVYRITQTTPEGETFDYSWNQVKKRCEELGVNHVPELSVDIVPNDDPKWIKAAEQRVQFYTNSESQKFPHHIREGICVRVESGKFTPDIYKHKAFTFKVMEGHIKDKDDYIDLEEAN